MVAQGRSLSENVDSISEFTGLFLQDCCSLLVNSIILSTQPHMFQHLTTLASIEDARQQITTLFQQHAEWFCTAGRNETYALRRNEIEVSVAHQRLVLSC